LKIDGVKYRLGGVYLYMNEMPNTRIIELCQDGLSLFPIGATLPGSVLLDLRDIDRSSLDGNMERFLASEGDHFGEKSYFCKKLTDGKYSIGGLAVKSILVVYNEFAEIQKTIVRLNSYDFISIKIALDAVYGDPKVSKINHKSHQQVCVWSGGGFDVVFWGLSGLIEFYRTPVAPAPEYN